MTENPIPKPDQHIPRTPEEAAELFARLTHSEKSDLLSKNLLRNKKIEDAIKVVQMMDRTEGWPVFAAAIGDLRDMVAGEASIANMTGDLFAKAAKVENLQGRMSMLEYIQTVIDEFKKQSREQPVDVAELQKYLDENK